MANKPAAYSNRLKEQVVGQLFFQSVVEVDQYKSKFSGVRLSSLLICFRHVKYMDSGNLRKNQDCSHCAEL